MRSEEEGEEGEEEERGDPMDSTVTVLRGVASIIHRILPVDTN